MPNISDGWVGPRNHLESSPKTVPWSSHLTWWTRFRRFFVLISLLHRSQEKMSLNEALEQGAVTCRRRACKRRHDNTMSGILGFSAFISEGWNLGEISFFTFLRKPQHTIGAYPRNPETPKWKEFLHKPLVGGLGYVPGVCWKILRTLDLVKRSSVYIVFLSSEKNSSDKKKTVGKRIGRDILFWITQKKNMQQTSRIIAAKKWNHPTKLSCCHFLYVKSPGS